MSRGDSGDAGVSWPARPLQARTDSASCRPATFVIGLLLILGLVAAPAVATAEGRVALVVGNSAYAAIGELPNPGNDAADVGAALGRLGFAVTTVRDADRGGIQRGGCGPSRGRAWGRTWRWCSMPGTAWEMDGVNYLVPVDAQLERDTDVRYETVALDDVLAAVEGAALRVVILDACRNNPLARSMTRTSATRSVSRGSFGELDEGLLGNETLVAYAAAAGTTAADGTGRNSPYTAALLAYLEEPLELSALFRRVRGQVLEATAERQRPHEYGSLLAEHYLSGASGAAPVTVAAVVGATSAARVQQETVFWQSIADSEESADFEAYLRQFPEGTYRELATNRATALRAAAADLPVVTESPSVRPSASAVSRPPVAKDATQVTRELSAMLGRELSVYGSDENGWTDLHYAAVLNLPDLVFRLVGDFDRDIVNARIKRDGASLSDRLKRSLREFGYDFDDWTRDGETPLHVAAFVGAREATAKLLAGGADLDVGTKFDWKPLHYAAWANAPSVIEALLAYGADTDAETDEVNQPGRTPLQIAVQAGNREAVAALRAHDAAR